MELTERQRAALDEVFEAFNRHDIPYVVLRGHAELPERLHGGDVDVFVPAETFSEAVAVCGELGLESFESRRKNVFTLVSEGVHQPLRALSLLVAAPDDVVRHVRKRLFGVRRNHAVVERSFDGAVRLHLLNRHAYTSPLSGSKIRVDPAVEEAMLDRRIRRGALYVPDTPDELTHLVCRGVFDYEGTFPDYYRERCDQLVEALHADEACRAQFQSLLERVFFDAHRVVFELVVAGEYDDIRDRLVRFAAY